MKNIKWYLLDFIGFFVLPTAFILSMGVFGTCTISSIVMLEIYVTLHVLPCTNWFVLVVVTYFILLPLVIISGRKCYMVFKGEGV